MGDDLSPERPRVVAVVQARMSSTRLPGKVLTPIAGEPALGLLMRRLRRARELDAIVLATSTEPSDDPIFAAGEELGVATVRGPLEDVLGRYVAATRQSDADGIVRITADCPLIDPEVVDAVCAHWRATGCDYVSNTFAPRSYPDGLDVEILSRDALLRVDAQATERDEREHVTLYMHRHGGDFTTGELRLEPSLGDVRITLDTAEDRAEIERIVRTAGADALMADILQALGVTAIPAVRSRP